MVARKSMPVVVPSSYVHRNFGELTRRVFSGQEHFVVERDGMPLMAIISMTEYQELLKEHEAIEQEKQERLHRFQQAAREIGVEIEQLGLNEEQVNAVVEAARQELHDKQL